MTEYERMKAEFDAVKQRKQDRFIDGVIADAKLNQSAADPVWLIPTMTEHELRDLLLKHLPPELRVESP